VSSIARDYATIVPGGDAPAGYRLVDTTPLEGSIHDLVSIHRGRFYEGPLCFQQEPHWPFAWSRAAHDWILRLDADEFPSGELRSFLQSFRKQSVERAETAGFACVWPFWDGKKATTRNWPNDRLFLFNRRKVKFFGMAEQTPIPQGKVERRKEVLRHEPHGKRYGLRKVIMRKQAGRWRRVIAESLLESPLSLPRWQWREAEWPEGWQRLRGQPIREAFCRLLLMPIHQAREMRRTGNRVDLSACYGSAVQHFLLGLLYWTLARSRSRTMHRLVTSNQ
jgi:hypothetical protein